jgi:sulfotransferase family protein
MSSVKEWLKQRLSAKTRQQLKRVFNWPPTIDVGKRSDAVFLAGTGRSGTGWVANIMNYDNRYRYLYEPFSPKVIDTVAAFTWGLYIRPNDKSPQYVDPARWLLEGKVGHYPKLDRANHRIFATKRMLKETRGNLWLKWLHVNFPEVKIILLMRHPCAAVNSRIKRGNLVLFEPFLDQPALMEDHLGPFKAAIEQAKGAEEFEQRIFMWCINYYVPLRQFAPGEIHIAFYENFAEHPKEEIERLFKFTGEPYDDRVLEAIKKPSEVTRPDAAVITGRSIVSHWQEEVGPERTRRAIDVLRQFGLDRIYSEDPMPNVDGATAVMAKA